MTPLSLIIIGLLVLAILFLLFWPESGIYWRRQKSRSKLQRVLLEDALKHIYDCEYNDTQCGLNSIAGNLHISSDKSAELVEELREMKLIEIENDFIRLTDEGRLYALRIIRNHRLWEKYLADHTGVSASEWHFQAEEAEHELSKEDAEKLASQIGNPVIDPHGDPIPSSSGEIQKRRGIQLTNLQPGRFARIVHIEDEPYAVYSQIIASGIHLGMQIKLIESSKERVKFFAEGDEIVLSPVVAANLSVVPLERSEEKEEYKTLTSLRRGESAKVVGISKACRGQQRRRLMDLGIVKGSEIKYRMESAGKDPVAYDVRGATVALRKAQTDQIFIT